MAVKILAPNAVQISAISLARYDESQIYFLGYGRNAWQSTWINRYYSNTLSFSIYELKKSAEPRRVQGSVFKIEAVPMIVLTYIKNAFGVCVINDCSSYEYNRVFTRIKADRPQNFWKHLPEMSDNWMLIVPLGQKREFDSGYRPSILKSHSNGSRHYLGWEEGRPNQYPAFQQFGRDLFDLFKSCNFLTGDL